MKPVQGEGKKFNTLQLLVTHKLQNQAMGVRVYFLLKFQWELITIAFLQV